VHRWSPLLRAVVATASNDHRLGANEAPPAIISIFLGDQLADIFEQVAKGGAKSSKGKETLKVGVDSLPTLPKDAGDRNRTSPFAFTGNRFEFRAVGSSQSIAGPLVAMNTIMTESLDFIATKLEQSARQGPEKFNAAMQQVLEEILAEHGSVVFNGDNYSETWHREAQKRGLPNLRSCVDALPLLGSKESIELFSKYGVLSQRELHSRMDVYLEQYCLSVALEARTAIEMAKTIIFPAAIRYQGELAATCANLKAVGYVFDTDRSIR
jgi:glutamine synthetase